MRMLPLSGCTRCLRAVLTGGVILATTLPVGGSGESGKAPFHVKIHDEKAVVVEAEAPIDPAQRIKFQPSGNTYLTIQGERDQMLQLSHFPTLYLDGRAIQIGPGEGRIVVSNGKLSKTATGKDRIGYMTVCEVGNIRVTQTLEVVPTRTSGPGQKRRMDAVLIKHIVENKGKESHKVGMRVYMDTYIVDNDGALFAAPTIPGKVLDNLELKEKTMPEYVQILQRPDLKNPGFVAHMTFNLGASVEKAQRVVLTRHGAGFGAWDMQPAMAGGDSAMGVFWDPKELKPGAKRETGYTYGEGIGIAPESEGRFSIAFGGSFEPGKLFTITAMVNDPASGQTLALELPKGMERVEGKEIQPVPAVMGERAQSMVLWKARVLAEGTFPLRIRSSTGVTHTKTITISKSN